MSNNSRFEKNMIPTSIFFIVDGAISLQLIIINLQRLKANVLFWRAVLEEALVFILGTALGFTFDAKKWCNVRHSYDCEKSCRGF